MSDILEITKVPTVKDAAIAFGVTMPTISNWARGGNVPHLTLEKFIRFLTVLELDPTEFHERAKPLFKGKRLHVERIPSFSGKSNLEIAVAMGVSHPTPYNWRQAKNHVQLSLHQWGCLLEALGLAELRRQLTEKCEQLDFPMHKQCRKPRKKVAKARFVRCFAD